MARWGRRYLVHSHYSKTVPTKRLTLIGKPGCHLCDDARETINAVIAELPAECSVELIEQSILDDEALHAQYWDEIPVVLINDRVHTIWRVEPQRLSAALLEETE
ncbi:thioredoxin family protein [Salinibacterium amurskyense]|nr:glutaredoxin family protein [Salinibacterium amurskyense]GHD83451.1 thioredoxin family protein [Salinibacterium amurskyense]